jgi:HEAT repeat protein
MSGTVLAAVAYASFSLLVCLASLVAAKKLARNHSERTSRARADRFAEALAGAGPVELEARARAARRSRAAQEDLGVALARVRPGLEPERIEVVEGALAAAGLVAVVERLLGSRSSGRRTRGVLLATWFHAVRPLRLEPLLRDADPDIRIAAVRAIAIRRTPEAARTLIRLLASAPVPPERIVERLAGAWSVPVVAESLGAVQDAGVRAWLGEALGLAGDPTGAPPLMRGLETGTVEERVRACRALGRLGLRASIPALIRALNDEHDAVRAQAARALEAIPDARSLAPLGARLADSSWWVRANSARALVRLGPPGLALLELAAGKHRDRFARQRASEALTLERMRPRRRVVAA